MSLKVLCFGDGQFVEQVVAKVRPEEREIDPEDQIIVDNVEIAGKSFLLFSIRNPELIGSQSTGTTSIMYFLDVNLPIYEQKQLLFNILDERKQFQGLPIIILFDKDQYLQIKEIVNSFELFKIKDRASMIKQIDLNDKATINEIFTWVDNQNQFRKTRTFDAPPKIVKMKPKYRQFEPETTQKKYEAIVTDKKFKGMNVKNQQEAYIDNQKEKIKNQNMQKQLANFNRNKKKMSPYDIKATPNPKIQANLHFFLKDPRVQKTQEVNIKIQTDQFKELPKPKPYVAKKTGINAATQIEPTQLFQFDKEVRPILQILTTRALEEATLEIQQHQECLKMAKYKNTYNDRVKKQKKHENDNIQTELQAIKQKQRILEVARKKDQNKKIVAKKQTYYSIAGKFLQGIYKSSAVNLYKKNFYPNQYQHQLKTEYIPDVLELALKSYDKILEKQKSLNDVFEKACFNEIIQKSRSPKIANKQIKQKKEQRSLNKGNKLRYVYIAYDHPIQKKYSSFSKYLQKELDGSLEQYLKTREAQIQQIDDKLQSGEVDQSQVTKIKEKDNLDFANDHQQFLLNSDNIINYTVTSNRFEKPTKPHQVVGGVYCFNNQGSLIQTIETCKPSENKYIKCVNDLRHYRSQVNMDDGLVINLQQIPENVKSLIFYTKVNNVNYFAGENQSKEIKNAVYGLQFYEKAIPIKREVFGEKINWQEFAKPVQEEGDEAKKANKLSDYIILFSYHLKRRTKQFWQFEEIKVTSKSISDGSEQQFTQKISSFFKQSLQIFKVEEEQPKPIQKTPSRGSKRKSRKAIEEEKEKEKQKISQKVELGLTSRVLKETKIDLQESWTEIFNKLGDEVIEWKQFIENSPDGWYLQFRGKKLEDVEQIKKFNKVGDIKLKVVEPKVEEIKPQVPQDGEQAPEEDA